MWEGRFHKETNKLLEKFNASITFDKRMYEEDIKGSIAHSRMLGKQGIISSEEQKEIENGLLQIKNEIENGTFEFKIEDEDIHMSIEKRLTEIIGAVAGKLHTARSRNDQVALDVRMYDVYEEMDRDHREPLSIDVQQTACSFGYQKHSDNRLLDNCYACEFLFRQLIHDHKNI